MSVRLQIDTLSSSITNVVRSDEDEYGDDNGDEDDNAPTTVFNASFVPIMPIDMNTIVIELRTITDEQKFKN